MTHLKKLQIVLLLGLQIAVLGFLQSSAFADEDDPTPPYDKVDPSKAFGLRAAISKIPFSSCIGNTYQIYGEYLLPWQKAGVFSLGAHFGSIPLYITDVAGINSDLVFGVQAVYQLKFWHTQPVIPTLGVEYEYMRLYDNNGGTFSLTPFGVSFGVMISLNPFDLATVRDAYASIGLTHGYFTMEYQPVSLSTPTHVTSGGFWLWGVRLEFE